MLTRTIWEFACHALISVSTSRVGVHVYGSSDNEMFFVFASNAPLHIHIFWKKFNFPVFHISFMTPRIILHKSASSKVPFLHFHHLPNFHPRQNNSNSSTKRNSTTTWLGNSPPSSTPTFARLHHPKTKNFQFPSFHSKQVPKPN